MAIKAEPDYLNLGPIANKNYNHQWQTGHRHQDWLIQAHTNEILRQIPRCSESYIDKR
jgi:hypothetical protein